MKVEYLNPFVISTCNTFETMLGVRPERGTPQLKPDNVGTHEVSAIIGMSGTAKGVVVFSLSKKAAMGVVSKLLGDDVKIFDREVADGVGEIVNIIAGGAKAELAKQGMKMSLSLPSVIIGLGHKVLQKSDVPRIMIPFTAPVGEFTVEFSLKETAG